MDYLALAGLTGVICTGAAWFMRGRDVPPSTPRAAQAPDLRELEKRVALLEIERPKFIGEMNGLVAECDELLERTERRRRRVQREDQNNDRDRDRGQGELELVPPDRESLKEEVRKRFG